MLANCKLHVNCIQYLQTESTTIIGKQIVQISAIKFPTARQWLDHLQVTQQCWQSLVSLWRPEGTEIYLRTCRRTRTRRNALDQSVHTFPHPTFIPSLIFPFLTFLTTLTFSPIRRFSHKQPSLYINCTYIFQHKPRNFCKTSLFQFRVCKPVCFTALVLTQSWHGSSPHLSLYCPGRPLRPPVDNIQPEVLLCWAQLNAPGNVLIQNYWGFKELYLAL
jgi:hypothetical protein